MIETKNKKLQIREVLLHLSDYLVKARLVLNVFEEKFGEDHGDGFDG